VDEELERRERAEDVLEVDGAVEDDAVVDGCRGVSPVDVVFEAWS